MIVATAVGGVAFALFGGQPLTILGGTGPIVIFTGLLAAVCKQLARTLRTHNDLGAATVLDDVHAI